MTDTDVAVRCSAWARQVELSPVGTIGSYAGYLLVETPLPWPRDVGAVPALEALAGRVSDAALRVQALVPADLAAGPEHRRVILHHARTDTDGFAGYTRSERTIGDSLEGAVDTLLARASAGSGVPSASAAAADGGSVSISGDRSTGVTDLLVCTHGRRDVCCGSLGTDLALRLAAQGFGAGVHLWRTSHTGGHRFAPTFVVLPEGTGWAFADPELVHSVLDRSVPFAQVAAHYRGCAGLGGPQVQALEREVLTAVGWELLDRPRRGLMTGEPAGAGGSVVRLEAGADRWEAVVSAGRTLPVPDCTKPLSDAKKTETEWVVSDVRAVR